MDHENKEDQLKAQADNNSIAIGGINVGGSVGGNITIGHTSGYTVEEVSVLLTQITSTFQLKPFDGRCPYKGLDVFDEDDADLFFGRERLVNDLIARVKESRTVFITGPSGSGKSSLVRAGLLHDLKQGAIQDLHSERWLYETMKPGREPLKDLALAFSRLKSPELADYFLAHAGETDVLHKCAESVLSGHKGQRFVLFVDQFEEVFTQISQEEERLAFLNLLAHAGTVQNGRVIVLFAMRSDFVSNCATYPMLNELLSQQFRQIGAMQPEELVSAIALPAKHVGLPIEDELVARIINDMKGEPGALPLMQFALKDLFDSQQERGGVFALKLEDYLQQGGIHKSLERHADKSFAKLSENEQELARSIFSGLIEIGRGTSDTRRTTFFDELITANTKAEDVGAIVQKLANARLIITDEQAGKDTVTISHEKLIDAWPWLKKLVNENRDVIALQNEVANDAKEWEEHKRDGSYLYSGVRLANAREQLKSKKLMLSKLAQEFVKASGARRRQNQLALVSSISLVIVLLIIAVIFSNQQASQAQAASIFAVSQQGTAQAASTLALAQKATAQANADELQKQLKISQSEELAARAISEKDSRFDLALLFGLEGIRAQENSRTEGVLLSLMDSHPALERYLWQHGYAEDIALSPDGKQLASGSGDSTIILWDVSNPTNPSKLAIMSGHHGAVHSIAFSPNGALLASGSEDKTIILWDVSNPTNPSKLTTLSGHEGFVWSVAFSPNGALLASGSEDKTIILWDVSNPTNPSKLSTLSGHDDSIVSVTLSPDGTKLASGSLDKTIILWDVSTPTNPSKLTTLSGHGDYVWSVAFSPDGTKLASGSWDNTIILWDVSDPVNPSKLATMSGHDGPVLSVAFSQDGTWLISGGRDSAVILWNIDNPISPSKFSILRGHRDYVKSIAFSPDGTKLASGSRDKTIILWDVSNPTNPSKLAMMSGHDGPVLSVAFSPDGTKLASGSRDKTIILWDVSDPTKPLKIATLSGHEDTIESVAFSPDGTKLASGSDDTTIILWDVSNPANPSKLNTLIGSIDKVENIAFSPDGTKLASGNNDATIILWDVSNPANPSKLNALSGHGDSVYAVAFSPDGTKLASGSDDTTIILWNISDPIKPLKIATLLGHRDSVRSVTFSPDGSRLASGGDDNVVILWNVSNPANPSILATLSGHSSLVEKIAFSPDGNWLASGSRDNTAILWNLDLQSLIINACKIIGRNFTQDEWQQYLPSEEYHRTCPQWSLQSEATP